ncbi:MAG: hypothetical protein JOZ57_07355 [Abitibacteriaceae bacterium]|nr:hypothetical protein [Abditibacteriaceae bacterium]
MLILLIVGGYCLINVAISYLLIQHIRRTKERAKWIAQHSVMVEVD